MGGRGHPGHKVTRSSTELAFLSNESDSGSGMVGGVANDEIYVERHCKLTQVCGKFGDARGSRAGNIIHNSYRWTRPYAVQACSYAVNSFRWGTPRVVCIV